MTHPRLNHVEMHAIDQGFPKICNFSRFKGFKPELLLPEVASNINKLQNISGNGFVTKDQHF